MTVDTDALQQPLFEVPTEPTMDEEQGTAFDWVNFPIDLFIDRNRVIEQPDRSFVTDLEGMLRKDGYARAVWYGLTFPIKQANLSFVKPKDDRGQTAWLEKVLMDPPEAGGMKTPMELVWRQMTAAVGFRRTYFEKVWTRQPRTGKEMYSKIAWRPPNSCELIRDVKTGQLHGFRQFQDWHALHDPGSSKPEITLDSPDDRDDPQYVEILGPAAFVHLHGIDRDPLYGATDLDATYWAYEMKQKILYLWFLFLDNQALPKVLAYGSDPTEARNRARLISKLRSSGVAPLPRNNPDEKIFDLLESSGTGAAYYQDMCRYLEGQMAISVLAGWLDLTLAASGGRGSYALSADQSGIFMASRFDAAKEQATSFTYEVSAPLIARSWGTDALVPHLVVERTDEAHANTAITLLTSLATSQSQAAPAGFLELLIERVAQYLDLPDVKVREMLDAHHKEQEEKRKLAADIAKGGITPNVATPPGAAGTPAARQAVDQQRARAATRTKITDTVDGVSKLVQRAVA